jgi:hypothetical protein
MLPQKFSAATTWITRLGDPTAPFVVLHAALVSAIAAATAAEAADLTRDRFTGTPR